MWSAVDEKGFVYVIIWEYEVRHTEEDTIKISEKRLRAIVDQLPQYEYLYYFYLLLLI